MEGNESSLDGIFSLGTFNPGTWVATFLLAARRAAFEALRFVSHLYAPYRIHFPLFKELAC